MIADGLLGVLAWLGVGVTGAPVDPFLPVAAALALHRPWPVPARIAAAVALGPIAAAATGDLAVERTGLYAAVALLAAAAGSSLRDDVITRTGLVAATLMVVVGLRTLMATGGTSPAPGETSIAMVATILWTAVHATTSLGWGRLRARLLAWGTR